MPLYIVALKGPAMQFTTRSVLLRAPDPKTARTIASKRHGQEGPEIWFLPKESSCVQVEPEGKPGVLMSHEVEE